ncbi:MAG TPA: GNAT family N-acetyltransferase [Thermofilum sp.]|nr:GNAT family N-acetyltransferase [Thermofilum sp.]
MVRLFVKGVVKGRKLPKSGLRWSKAELEVETGEGIITIELIGTVAQWLYEGDRVKIEGEISSSNKFRVYRLAKDGDILLYPLFRKEYRLERKNPVTGEPLYEYNIVAREAETEEDYRAIVELEQYHYASKKELVAIWRCPSGKLIESNVPPDCETGGAELVAIKGSLPASRFLVLELEKRQSFEPRIVAYVRVDPPIPLMHRRIVKNGKVEIEKNIRLKVFPYDWIYPTFWPEKLLKKLKEELNELRAKYGRKKALYLLSEKIKDEALKRCNSAGARIARVVVHPDYRGDGLGMLAVSAAIEWVRDRSIPEMKRRKHFVETIAQMARYHPFFERVGFKYLWDTASGRPALYYPLTDEAKTRIEKFLKEDPYARKHGGVLYRPRYGGIKPLTSPIIVKNITKMYSSELDVSRLQPDLRTVLEAFGVRRRIIQRYVLRDVNLEINPREIVAVVGISGAGKTTLLRMIIGEVLNIGEEKYRPDRGEIHVPENARLAALLPGELEPAFGDEPLLQHMYEKLENAVAAIEVLNISGLSDAVFYRARFSELSTGQKERAKIASLLADRPNIIVIDEFTAHLDALTAQKVARKLTFIARKHGITLIVATNRSEVLRALSPDKIVFVGYGNVIVKTRN